MENKHPITYQKEILKAFDMFVYDKLSDDDSKVHVFSDVLSRDPNDCYRIPFGDHDKRTYLSATKEGDKIRVKFDSSHIFYISYGGAENAANYIADLLKKNGVDGVVVTESKGDLKDAGSVLSFEIPDTLDSVKLLRKIFRDDVVECNKELTSRLIHRMLDQAKVGLEKSFGGKGPESELAFSEVLRGVIENIDPSRQK